MNISTDYHEAIERLHEQLLARHCSQYLRGPATKSPIGTHHIDRYYGSVPVEFKTDRYPSWNVMFLELLVNLSQNDWAEEETAHPGTERHARLLKAIRDYDSIEDNPQKQGLVLAKLPPGHKLSYLRYVRPALAYQRGLRQSGATLYLFETQHLQRWARSNLERMSLRMVDHGKNLGWTGIGALVPHDWVVEGKLREAGLIAKVGVTAEVEEYLAQLPPQGGARTPYAEATDEQQQNEGPVGDAPSAGRADSGEGVSDGEQRREDAGARRDGSDRARNETGVVPQAAGQGRKGRRA